MALSDDDLINLGKSSDGGFRGGFAARSPRKLRRTALESDYVFRCASEEEIRAAIEEIGLRGEGGVVQIVGRVSLSAPIDIESEDDFNLDRIVFEGRGGVILPQFDGDYVISLNSSRFQVLNLDFDGGYDYTVTSAIQVTSSQYSRIRDVGVINMDNAVEVLTSSSGFRNGSIQGLIAGDSHIVGRIQNTRITGNQIEDLTLGSQARFNQVVGNEIQGDADDSASLGFNVLDGNHVGGSTANWTGFSSVVGDNT